MLHTKTGFSAGGGESLPSDAGQKGSSQTGQKVYKAQPGPSLYRTKASSDWE